MKETIPNYCENCKKEVGEITFDITPCTITWECGYCDYQESYLIKEEKIIKKNYLLFKNNQLIRIYKGNKKIKLL